jgi:23S rRNA (cytidine1920-2'-O)/16S rRNA (cytidine1409-2'-O)-methyltransferase
MVILVKPQFEAGKGQVGKGGIVRDARVRAAAAERVAQAARALGFQTAAMESPIPGAKGNQELLLHVYH